jgi:sec-independent protein translocase protein TatA
VCDLFFALFWQNDFFRNLLEFQLDAALPPQDLRRRAQEAVTMEGKIGIWEILLIVGIALLLFGPSKFASLGKSIGEGLRNFKSAMKEEPAKKDDSNKS